METVLTSLLTILMLISVNAVLGQKVNMNTDKVANNGYDVVNYFTAHTAERGNKEFSTSHNGATYYFVNAMHLKMFEEHPDKYLPQFDGYCAFAVAKMNQKVPVDPETFRIDDGKLYLFFNDFFEGKPFNTLIPWVNHEAELEKTAMENWQSLKDQ